MDNFNSDEFKYHLKYVSIRAGHPGVLRRPHADNAAGGAGNGFESGVEEIPRQIRSLARNGQISSLILSVPLWWNALCDNH